MGREVKERKDGEEEGRVGKNEAEGRVKEGGRGVREEGDEMS